MNRIILSIGVCSLVFTGCSQGDDAYGAHYGPSWGDDMTTESAESPPPPDDDVGEDAPGTNRSVGAGQLTAGSWDDNLFYDHYRQYVQSASRSSNTLPIDRVVIEVTDNEGAPINDGVVTISADGQMDPIRLQTVADGRTLFFPSADGEAEAYTVTVVTEDDRFEGTFFAEDPTWSITMEVAPSVPAQTLDLAFVIDATGSMGDEIEYLKSEAEWLIGELQASHPKLTIRLATVAYRDEGDEYVTRVHDFTTHQHEFFSELRNVVAHGGGDYPEAMGEGMEAATGLEWSKSSAIRIAFVLADAPPQTRRQATTANAARIARQKGIRIYPIGASGVADQAEFVMRQMAQHTLGRYLFLTDDSGIGNTHAEPHIPCYHVQRLNGLMLQVIESNIAGIWTRPIAEDIVRSVGYDQNGQCSSPQVQPTEQAEAPVEEEIEEPIDEAEDRDEDTEADDERP